MTKDPKIAAFSNGDLVVLQDGTTSREAVLALPFSRLLVKMLRVPKDQDPIEFAQPVLKALSPFPDEALTPTIEVVRESDDSKIVIAAALPESAADDVAEALDAAKLNVVRVDALALGALRGFWNELKINDDARRLLVLRGGDSIALIVLDGAEPASIRAISGEADLKRETMLSLLEAEDFNGSKPLVETIEKTIEIDSALAGIRARANEAGVMNALPESWREVLNESRFKAKLIRNLIVAGSIWALVMSVLLGVPLAYDLMTNHMKDLCRQHDRQYRQVSDKKAKTMLVQKYSDHARGALEIMKAISDRLPDDITLSSWDFKRAEGMRFRGEAGDSASVYEIKDLMVEMGQEEGGEAVFPVVNLGGVNSQKDGKQKFELECRYEEEVQ